ncbi:SCO2521 family protein [Streptomyces sp. NPDC026672]|uniref:SCO2521 family protein n=1 Tax=unclassified Streptomyces TaxID=2593676 RepID=UPI0033C51905
MPAGGAEGTGTTVLACGEVRTTLLATSRALSGEEACALLRLRAGDRVRLASRPVPYAESADVLTGVDCPLPTASGARVRAVGTVRARALLTGGRVLQSSARVALPADGERARGPWGRHLARPGTVRPFGRLPAEDVADGWLAGTDRPGELALGAVAGRLLADVTRQPVLDHRPPFRSRPTRLRWAALRAPAGQAPAIESLVLVDDGLRTARLRLPERDDGDALTAFCEDLALHDWLLTTLLAQVERSGLGSADDLVALRALRPAVGRLLHLWMPAARLDPDLAALWDPLERAPGFSRQWHGLAQRIRDQTALLALMPGESA